MADEQSYYQLCQKPRWLQAAILKSSVIYISATGYEEYGENIVLEKYALEWSDWPQSKVFPIQLILNQYIAEQPTTTVL